MKKWLVSGEINMDASRHKTVEVKANTERKARIFGKEKIMKEGAFYVTNIVVSPIQEETTKSL